MSQEVRINGDRINGLWLTNLYMGYSLGWNNPLIRSPLISHLPNGTSKQPWLGSNRLTPLAPTGCWLVGWQNNKVYLDLLDMDVSKNRATPKSSHFNRVFYYKPSILGHPYLWKHPYVKILPKLVGFFGALKGTHFTQNFGRSRYSL